jgi:hypothetical protein
MFEPPLLTDVCKIFTLLLALMASTENLENLINLAHLADIKSTRFDTHNHLDSM